MTWQQDDNLGSGLELPTSPERQVLKLLARLQQDAEELHQLVGELPVRTAAWRAAYANDATDFTVDRIGDDGSAWFAWWGYLLEHGRHPTFAIVSNLDAIDGIEQLAPGQLGSLRAKLSDGQIALRLIVPHDARSGAVGEFMNGLHDAGAELRVGDASDWFAVTPGRGALLPAVWGRDRDVDAMVVHTPAIVSALEQLFLARWAHAHPWDGGEGPAIELLCAGHTDDQVAEKLGISVRSVRRRVAAEMQRTGATTRTQLGYRLALERVARTSEPAGLG